MRYEKKHQQIMADMGWNSYDKELLNMYFNKNMSSYEISEYINQNTPNSVNITPRSISRTISKHQQTRDKGESFRLAIARGRVKWAYKEFKYIRHRLSSKLRYQVLKRDNFKCVKCGNNADNSLLEVDHIKPICQGGLSVIDNLETLCNFCNKGKQLAEKE